MKAIVYDRYGPPDVLRLMDVPVPEPIHDQVCIRVCRVSVNAPDWRLMRANPWIARLATGLVRPRIRTLGSDVAGTVVKTGPDVKQFRVGDDVFGDLARYGFGGFAEFVCAPERALARKPAGVSFDDAAATPMAASAALQALRDDGRAGPATKVLIVGASGGVGTFAIQIARLLEAEVTAVCSTAKTELARTLGARRVLDYTKDDFARSPERYDVVMAVNGYRPLRDYARVLTAEGRYLMVGGTWPQIREAMLLGPLRSLGGRQKFMACETAPTQPELDFLATQLENGRLRPVIDRHFTLGAVPDAIRYVEAGHAMGKVIVDVAEPARGGRGHPR